jgi:hypothetical protein
MKVLSLSQPWATLAVLGAKRFETRGWQTGHRGPLAVHAARRFPSANRLLCYREPVRALLRAAGFEDWSKLPCGAVVGTVEVVGCVPADELTGLSEFDRALGDFSPGRWAWQLRGPCRWPTPVPAAGRLGVFELDLTPPGDAA